MKEYKSLAWPLYLTGLGLILVPAVEFVLTASPVSPTILSWRYGAIGLFSRAVVVPTAGVVVIFGTAVLLEHQWVRRAAWVVGFAGGALLLLVVGLFTLDVLQFRHQVRTQALAAFDAANALALLKLLTAMAVLLSVGVSGLRTARHTRASRRNTGSVPLIAGREREHAPTPAP